MLFFAVLEVFFGVLKSKGSCGLNLMFWTCLTIEFACTWVLFAALFIGEHGALRVDIRNRGIRILTSSLAVAIDGILLLFEAEYVGRILYGGSWFVLNSRRSTIISVALFPLLVAPAILLLITSFWSDVNDCYDVNRSLFDTLTIVVTATPVICLVVAGFVSRIVKELKVTKRVAVSTTIFVAYVCYSAPVLALGILLMRTPSDCDKHAILLISNLIPPVVACCAALVLYEGRNSDSGYPEAPDEIMGVALSDASIHLPDQADTSDRGSVVR